MGEVISQGTGDGAAAAGTSQTAETPTITESAHKAGVEKAVNERLRNLKAKEAALAAQNAELQRQLAAAKAVETLDADDDDAAVAPAPVAPQPGQPVAPAPQPVSPQPQPQRPNKFAARLATERAEWEKTKAELEKAKAETEAKLRDTLIKTSALSALGEYQDGKVRDPAEVFTLTREVLRISESGEVVAVLNDGDELPLPKFYADWLAKKPHHVAAPAPGTGGGSGRPAGAPKLEGRTAPSLIQAGLVKRFGPK